MFRAVAVSSEYLFVFRQKDDAMVDDTLVPVILTDSCQEAPYSKNSIFGLKRP